MKSSMNGMTPKQIPSLLEAESYGASRTEGTLGDQDNLLKHFTLNGFAVVDNVYSSNEVAAILELIQRVSASSSNFRRTTDLFAIRNLLAELPALSDLIHNHTFTKLLQSVLPAPHYLVKAIYFDKPPQSNWLVAWHQDLMIAVDRRVETPEFGPWSVRAEGITVQPSRAYLENICTFRIHLDACDAGNGALRIVPTSHQHGAIPAANLPSFVSSAILCPVSAGGVMLMKPLTLHASRRSTDARSRRVIHLEFSSLQLPNGLQWRENASS
jgi:ectoine hydroxylase-related dioxygenase (phytanoyl-CoA dioxygenase family)